MTTDNGGKRMTKQDAKDRAVEYRWPLITAAVGAVLFGLGLSWDAVKDPATIGAIGSGLVSLVQYAIKRGEKKSVEAVTSAANWEKLLAAMAIRERLDQLQADLSEKHEQNLEALTGIHHEQSENARLHAEHIAVTDSHAAALIALEGIGRKVDETFQLPPLHRRQPATERALPTPEAGDAERAA